MNRRRLLATLGSLATAGCLARPGGSRTGTDTDHATDVATTTPTRTPRRPARSGTDGPTPTAVPPSERPRHVSLAGVNAGGLADAFDVGATVAVPDARVTAGSTAAVRVRLRNRGNRRRRLTYLARECGANFLFGSRRDGDGRLVLVPAGRPGAAGNADECWRTGPETTVVSCGIPVTTNTVELSPGERITWTFALLQPRGGRCLPPGRYGFARRFGSRRTGDDGEGSTVEGTTATLSFGLGLAFT